MPTLGNLAAQESAELAAHVAGLAKAGLPLAGGLRALAGELPRGRLARAVGRLGELLAAGMPLDEALAQPAVHLPAHVRGLILAGVRSGRLPRVLEEFVDLTRTQQELRRRVVVSLFYPALVAILLVCLMQLPRFFTGEFAKIFKDFGTALPALTVFCLASATPLAWGSLLLLSPIVVVLALSWLTPFSGTLAELFGGLPVVGPIVRWGRLSEFCRLMAMMVEQGAPLPEALRLTSAGVRDAGLAAGCRQVAATVTAGCPLDAALAASRYFPPSLVPIIGWGQQHAALADAFRSAAEVYEGQARGQSSLVEAILPPVIFLVVVTGAGLFVIAILLPLISLVSMLSG